MANGRSFLTSFSTKWDNKGITGLRSELKELRKEMSENKKQQKEYSKEIREAQAEIKAIEKEIRATGSATDAQKQRIAQLTALIDNDTEAIERLRVEQSRLQNQINDTNDQIKREQEALAKLKEGMGGAKSAAKELVTEVGAIASAAAAATAGLFAFTREAAQWADSVNTLAVTTGLGTDEIQKFMYASNLVDVSLDTMTGSLTKLNRSMASAIKSEGSEAAQVFKSLGISVTDAAGRIRDREEVFYEVIDALGGIENETERNIAAMALFGKSAEALNPLIEGGAKKLREIGDEAERAGLILSQDVLDNLNSFNDKVDLLSSKGTAIKNLLASEMTPALDGLLEVGDELLNEINRLAQSGELKKIAKEIGEGIRSAAEALKNIITFVWEYKEAIGAAVAGMVAFRVAMSIANLVKSLVTVFQALTSATQAQTVAQGALNGTMAANPIGALISLVVGLTTALATLAVTTATNTDAVEAYSYTLMDNMQKMRELKENYDKTADSVAEEAAVLHFLREEYDELRSKVDLTAAEKKRLDEVAGEIAQSLGTETQALKDQSGAYRDLTVDIDEYIKSLEKQALIDYYEESIKQAAVNREKAEKDMKEADRRLLEESNNLWLMLTKYQRDHNESYISGISKYNSEIEKQIAVVKRAENAATKAKAAWSSAQGDIERYTGDLKALGNAADTAGQSTEGLNEDLDEINKTIAESTEHISELSKEQSRLTQQSSSLRGEMNSLAGSLAQLERGETLSLDTILQLIEKYPEYTEQLINAKDNAELQKAALEALFDAKKAEYILTQQAAIDIIDASDRETEVIIENVKKRIKAYQEEARIKGDIFGAIAKTFSAGWELSGLEATHEQNQRDRESLQQRIDYVSSLSYSDFASGTSGGSSGSSGGSSGGSSASSSSSRSSEKYTMDSRGVYAEGNSYLDAYTKWMDRAKAVGKLTADEEIQFLREILKREALTAEEREQVRQKLYAAEEKRAKAAEDAEKERTKAAEDAEKEKYNARRKEIQDYLTWIDRQKALGNISERKELEHLERLVKYEDLTADERYNIELRLHNLKKDLADKAEAREKERAEREAKAVEEAEQRKKEARELGKAALEKLIDDEISKHEAASNAAKKWADKEKAALDEVVRKRRQASEDEKRQNEIDLIDLKIRSGHLSEFEEQDLYRRKQDILNERYEAEFEQSVEDKKTEIDARADSVVSANDQAIKALQNSKTSVADRVAYLNGTQSYDQRVKNNTVTQNVTIVQNGLSADQLVQRVLKELGARS